MERTRLLKTLKVERKVTLVTATVIVSSKKCTTDMHRYLHVFTQVQLMYTNMLAFISNTTLRSIALGV